MKKALKHIKKSYEEYEKFVKEVNSTELDPWYGARYDHAHPMMVNFFKVMMDVAEFSDGKESE